MDLLDIPGRRGGRADDPWHYRYGEADTAAVQARLWRLPEAVR